jgi:hypothetical protein
VAISEKTREADEKLREELRHVDLAKLKKVIKTLVATPVTKKPKNKG